MARPCFAQKAIVLALAAGSAAASPARRADAVWSMPAEARIVDVRASVRKGYEADPMVKMCAGFRLSEQQVRAFLRGARTLTKRQLHDERDWLPCVVTARLSWPSHGAEVEISATLVGSVDVRNGPEYVLACDGECESAVARAGARREQRR